MPIKLTAKIEPKGSFIGMVDANQVIGTSGGRYTSYLPSSTISGNSIHEYQLKISNEPVDGYYLQYKNSIDKLTWAEITGTFDETQYMTSANIIANYPKSVQVLHKYYPSSLGRGISSQVSILSSWYNNSSQKLSDISGNLLTKYLQSSVATIRYQDSAQALLKFPGSSTIIGRYAPSVLTYNRYSEFVGHSSNISKHFLSSSIKMWFDGVYAPTGISFNPSNYITSTNAIERFADSSSIQSKFILSESYNASGAFYPSSLGKSLMDWSANKSLYAHSANVAERFYPSTSGKIIYDWYINSGVKLYTISSNLNYKIDSIEYVDGATISSNFFTKASGEMLWNFSSNSKYLYTASANVNYWMIQTIYNELDNRIDDLYNWSGVAFDLYGASSHSHPQYDNLGKISWTTPTGVSGIEIVGIGKISGGLAIGVADYAASTNIISKLEQRPLGITISSNFFTATSGNILWDWYSHSSSKLSDISGSLSDRINEIPILNPEEYVTSSNALSRFYPSALGKGISGAVLSNTKHSSNIKIHYLSGSIKDWFDGIYAPTGTAFNPSNYITSTNAIIRFADSSSIQTKFILSATYNASGAFYPSSLGRDMAGLSGGAKWLELTGGGETTLHTHPGGGGAYYWNSQYNVSPGSIYYGAGDVVIGPSGTHYGDYSFQVSGSSYFSGSVTFVGSLSGLSIPAYDSGAATKRYVDIISSNIINRYNCGYARVSSMGTIPHGLSSKPRYVSVEPSGLYVNFGMSCKADESNIIVAFTAAGMRDVFWTASV